MADKLYFDDFLAEHKVDNEFDRVVVLSSLVSEFTWQLEQMHVDDVTKTCSKYVCLGSNISELLAGKDNTRFNFLNALCSYDDYGIRLYAADVLGMTEDEYLEAAVSYMREREVTDNIFKGGEVLPDGVWKQLFAEPYEG